MAQPGVTILIPSHRRPELLRRALAHYAGSGLPVVVADSSPEPLAEPGAGVRYLHLPTLGFEAKLGRLAAEVTTPCAVLCSDDDITSVPAMLACAEFLEAHPDHSAAHGHYLRAVREAGKLVIEPCYRNTHAARVDADTATERLEQINRPYVPLFYAVMRAQALREAFGPGHELERFYASSELALGMAAAVLGKVAVLPLLHMVREIIPSVDLAGARNDNLRVVSTEARYAEPYGRFVARLSAMTARLAGLSAEAARAAILASVAGFVAGYCQPGRRKGFVRKLPKYAGRAARALLPPLAERARREAEAARRADLAAYLAPAGPQAWAELESIRKRLEAGA